MLLNFNGKTFRRSIGVVMLAGLVIVVGPALLRVQSAKAIVNARAVAINSPIEGVVSTVYVPAGEFATTGESILKLDNPRISEALLQELGVEQRSLAERVESLERQKARLQALLDELKARVSTHTSYETVRVNHQIAEAKAEAMAQKGAIDDLALTLEKNRKLLAENFISVVEFDRSKFALETARQKLLAIEARIHALEAGLNALGSGVYIGEGRNDVPYTQQKLEEITIQIIDLDARMSEARSRLSAIEQQADAEKERLAKLRQAEPIAPVTGLVWRQYYSVGSEVLIGTKLAEMVDCNDLYIEASLPASSLARLSRGDKVNYRLLGSDQWHVAEVMTLSGGASQVVNESSAARLAIEPGDGRVMIKFDSKDLKEMTANQCYVGRQVEVTLDRQWNPRVLLTRFSDLWH